ncbi:hypothetical protein E2C01_036495 [Portunus trituberculatus]|uniref:Uncharacterized protein n=1 Tax=Portunus trituberculatus TaxID=210409 RepID=A0A5B7FEB6_PORTR|nr:hypothetical protein [Portunus trituberculatus]
MNVDEDNKFMLITPVNTRPRRDTPICHHPHPVKTTTTTITTITTTYNHDRVLRTKTEKESDEDVDHGNMNVCEEHKREER